MDRSVTSSLLRGGKSTLQSLPCHGFPGYVREDRLEPAVVSACLIEIRLGLQFSVSAYEHYGLLILIFSSAVLVKRFCTVSDFLQNCNQ